MDNNKIINLKNRKCINPKCITNHESYAKPRFKAMDGKKDIYLCEFCSAENEIK